jgi:hypothetical protein
VGSPSSFTSTAPPAESEHQRAAPDPLAREHAEPQPGLDDVAVHRHPLRLGALGHQVVRDAGRGLEADAGHPAGQLQHEPERRRALLRVEQALAGRRPPRRVDERAAVAAELGGRRVLAADDGLGPVPQVDGGDGGGDLVALDRQDLAVEAGQRHRVGADPAAEVGDPLQPGRGEPLRVARGDREAGGLLQAGGREQHAVGERAELRVGRGAQPRLGQRGRDQRGRVALTAEPVAERHGRRLVVGR